MNDSAIKRDANEKPYLNGNNIMVPLRTVSDAIGFGMSRDTKTGVITVTWENIEGKLTVGKTEATINDRDYQLAAAPKIIGDSKNMIPLKFLMDCFGIDTT